MHTFIIPGVLTVIFLAVSVAGVCFGSAMWKAGYQRGYWRGHVAGYQKALLQGEATTPREAIR